MKTRKRKKMSYEQLCVYRRTLAKMKFFELGYDIFDKIIVHKDESLLVTDKKRYDQWKFDDCELVDRPEARRRRMRVVNQKGFHLSDDHKRKISAALRETHVKYMHKKIIVTNIDTNEKRAFFSVKRACEYIGCTKQLFYQVLSDKFPNKSANNFTIEVVESPFKYFVFKVGQEDDVKMFDTKAEAAEYIGCKPSNINYAVKMRYPKNGYIVQYKEIQ